uniref:Reverse transcriptase domain-containing protein n=1 Tax=Scylla olivacea TaxID=85551 RepID=A0A0P4WLH4_SCYOL
MHHITTTGPPLHTRAHRLPANKLSQTKEFRKMKEMGTMCCSDSPWASLLHMAQKLTGGWRPCWDYCHLNDITTADQYPVPYIQDFIANLGGAKFFFKIDLVQGYHQIPVHPDNIPKTAIITQLGFFKFLCMPFGLKNTAQAFQCLMDMVGRDLDFVFIYLDDRHPSHESYPTRTPYSGSGREWGVMWRHGPLNLRTIILPTRISTLKLHHGP